MSRFYRTGDFIGLAFFLTWLFLTGSVIVLALALLFVVLTVLTWEKD
jgi:hypothetical protein